MIYAFLDLGLRPKDFEYVRPQCRILRKNPVSAVQTAGIEFLAAIVRTLMFFNVHRAVFPNFCWSGRRDRVFWISSLDSTRTSTDILNSCGPEAFV